MLIHRAFQAAMAALSVAHAASAAPVLTHDPAVFAAATAGYDLTTQTFDGLPHVTDFNDLDFGDFTLNPAAHYADLAAANCRSGDCVSEILYYVYATFDSPVSAFGFWARTPNWPIVALWTDTDAGSGPPVTGPVNPGAYTFVGVYGVPMSEVRIDFSVGENHERSGFFALDDFTYGNPAPIAPVPLPATLPLLAAGALALGFLRRRA